MKIDNVFLHRYTIYSDLHNIINMSSSLWSEGNFMRYIYNVVIN